MNYFISSQFLSILQSQANLRRPGAKITNLGAAVCMEASAESQKSAREQQSSSVVGGLWTLGLRGGQLGSPESLSSGRAAQRDVPSRLTLYPGAGPSAVTRVRASRDPPKPRPLPPGRPSAPANLKEAWVRKAELSDQEVTSMLGWPRSPPEALGSG